MRTRHTIIDCSPLQTWFAVNPIAETTSGPGASRHFALPHDFGRKRVVWKSIGSHRSRKATFVTHKKRSLSVSSARTSNEAQCGCFCIRDYVVVVEPPSKSSMGSNLGVPDAQVQVGRIVSEAVLAGAPLN